MKLNHYHITFRHPLPEEQEDMLIGYYKGMLEQQEERYHKGQTKFRNDPILKAMMRVGGAGAFQIVRSRFDALLAEYEGKPYFHTYYKLDKDDNDARHWTFSAPDPDELMGAAGAMAAFPKPLVNMFKQIVAGDKDATMKWLHGTLTKDIGIEEGSFKIVCVKEV